MEKTLAGGLDGGTSGDALTVDVVSYRLLARFGLLVGVELSDSDM
jgi:hypothetical protein